MAAAEKSRYWKIVNPGVLNAVGEPVALQTGPGAREPASDLAPGDDLANVWSRRKPGAAVVVVAGVPARQQPCFPVRPAHGTLTARR